jgi:Flp pilus assembly protein TadG
MRKAFVTRLRRFAQDESAFISIEAIIVMPLLIWVFMALFVYWDAFRAENTSVKASYVLADMISRENAAVNTAYINGMHQVFRYMVNTPEQTWIRVSSVQFRASDNSYQVLWSRTTNATRAPAHTTATMALHRPRLPLLANSDTMIVLETWRRFSPPFQVGLDKRTFAQFTVMRPRFLSPLPIS